jgi:hypothetical protein
MPHSNTTPQTTTPKKAQPKQLSYLKALANRTGTSFTYPTTAAQASAEIKRLKSLKARGTSFAELDTKHGRAPKLTRTVSVSAPILRSEIRGYGSSAGWERAASMANDHVNAPAEPTRGQRRFLNDLQANAGERVYNPSTAHKASSEIDRLRNQLHI